MPKIVLSDVAPKDAKTFSLANASFDVPYETDDPVVVANADSHPWLDVEYPESDVPAPVVGPTHVAPEDDPLSMFNSVANDPEAVAAAIEEQPGSDPVAIDAGLDQNEPQQTESGVATTLAAADDNTDTKTSKRSSRKGD